MPALRTLLFLAVLLLPWPASAVTARDIIELTKAGLPDDVLVALIDADRTIFVLDKDQILELKEAGVSRVVLLKMLRSRREFEPSTGAGFDPSGAAAVVTEAAPPPLVVVIDPSPAPQPTTIVVPQYFYVPVPIWGIPARHAPRSAPQPFMAPERRGFGRFMNDGWIGVRSGSE
ncbi:MAG: hypothetical protein ACRD26_16740 [Vicinamibacterales bacterium]